MGKEEERKLEEGSCSEVLVVKSPQWQTSNYSSVVPFSNGHRGNWHLLCVFF